MCHPSQPEIWTYAELRTTLTRRQIDHARGTGSLVRLRRGVYAASTSCHAARAAAVHGGALGCESAARHLGLWVLDDLLTVHVWMHDDRHQYPHEPCACTTHWDAASAPAAFALPSVPRILRQIFGCRGEEAFFVALESARAQGLIDDRGLAWLRTQVGERGRDLVDFSRSDAGSGLESLVRLRLRPYGMSVRTQAAVSGTGDVDLLIDDWLIIETDGRENHDGASKRHKDLRRDANSAMWGLMTLRFDYALVVHDWDLVERAIHTTYTVYGPRRI